MNWEHWKDGCLNKGKLMGFGVGWDTDLDLPRITCIYKIIAGGKPYIGVTFDLRLRWKQHKQEAQKNNKKAFYKALKYSLDNNDVMVYVLFESDTRDNLEQFESLEIRKHNSFLNGWNQQIANELPSQTIKKYILDYHLIKDEELYEQIDWKISNTNLPWKVQSQLQRELWNSRWKNEK